MLEDLREITESAILIVEGKDEREFFDALLTKVKLQGIQILPVGGKSKIRNSLKAFVRMPGYEQVSSLAVLRDADTDPHGAFQSVQEALKNAGIKVPSQPFEFSNTPLRVGIAILPRKDKTGSLEDLCLEAVSSDPAFSCVNAYFECLKKTSTRLPENIQKHKVQAFLASRPTPRLQLGQAAKAEHWPFDNSTFDELKQFLNSLERLASFPLPPRLRTGTYAESMPSAPRAQRRKRGALAAFAHVPDCPLSIPDLTVGEFRSLTLKFGAVANGSRRGFRDPL